MTREDFVTPRLPRRKTISRFAVAGLGGYTRNSASRAMCPVCGQPLVAFELDGIEIDRCVECGGVWLDAGELEWIAEQAGVRPGGLTRALEEAKGRRHGKRHCPRCRRRLRVIHVQGNKREIELDRCPVGDGLWLDPGEIQALIAGLGPDGQGDEQTAVAAFFADFYGKKPNSSLPRG